MRNRSHSAIPRSTAVALALLTSSLLTAQEAEDFGFGEIVQVQLVNVEVWVADRQGRPIHGLSADDFEILEDGHLVPITHFAEVVEEAPVASSLERTLRAAEESETFRTPDVQPSHLVVYFDQLHLHPSSRNRVVEDLREFLGREGVPPERVLILSQEEGLRTEVSFGSSWLQIDEGLTRLAKTTTAGTRVEAEKRLAVRNLQDEWRRAREQTSSGGGRAGTNVDAACDAFLPRAVPDIEAFARESRARIALTLDHLASTASFLTGVPGVKTLLFVSDALERAPGADLTAYVKTLCPTQRAPLLILADELGAEFDRLTRHANANRVTIYSMQASGLQASPTGGAERASLDFRGSAAFDLALRNNERDGLSMLAAETGGRTIFNRNEFGAELSRIANEMRSYYSLAYEPPHGGDLGEHEIEVRVRNPSLVTRHRRGYRDKSADARMSERLQGAIYLGLVDNPLEVRLGAGELRVVEKGKLALPLHVLVPAERVTFLPTADGSKAQLSVQISSQDTRSGKGGFVQRVFRVDQPEDAAQELLSLVVDLEVPQGVHLVAVGLRDDVTLQSSFISTTLELSDAPATSRP